MADTELRVLDPRDPEQLEAFADLHEATLPDSVPVQFGRRFMTGFYFSRLVEDGLIAGDLYRYEGRYIGYNLYTKYPDSFMRRGVQRHFGFLLHFMPRVFAANPRALLAIPHALRNQGGFPRDDQTGYWLTFGVHPDFRSVRVEGKPPARLLVERMFDYFREEGFAAVEGTVEADNRAAIIFYKTCGFSFEDRGFEGGTKLQVRYEVTGGTGEEKR
ncbi:MAG: GNAT family N-acetyltransferase [Myxococcota bacterium]